MADKSAKTIQSPAQGKKGKGCSKGCLIFLIILIVFFGGLEVFRRYMVGRYEENYLKNYVPAAEVADIAEQTGLTDKAKKIFYRADPEFIGSDVFADYCLIRNGIEVALACARSDTPGEKSSKKPRIFILRIENPEFAGSKYPSSAHEILHIVYQAMTAEEKNRIGLLIDAEFARRQDDQHLAAIAGILKNASNNYQQDLRSEMHSIFGVEYPDLASELEQHYAQYFINRQKLVSLHENGGLEKRIRRLDELSQATKALDSQLTSLSSQISAYQRSGDMAKYKSMVPQFNNLVNQYNGLVREGNSIFNEMSSLYKLMNPNFQPPVEKN